MRANSQFASQFAITQNFNPTVATIGQAGRAQRLFIDARAFFETIKMFQIDRNVARGVPRIIKPTLGNAADQRHLPAFEADSNRAARARGLAFATAPAGFAVTAGFALAEPFAAMPGSGTGFEIVEAHG